MGGRAKRCYYCERYFGLCYYGSDIPLQRSIDHVYPRSKGGKNDKLNFVTACNKCNSTKSNMLLPDFLEKVEQAILGNKNFGDIKNELLPLVKINIERLIRKYENCTTSIRKLHR